MKSKPKLAINASRIRSGGGVAHLIGILNSYNADTSHFSEIHIWSYRDLLDSLPNSSWLIKHTSVFLEHSSFVSIVFEILVLPLLLLRFRIRLLFNVDAGSLCYLYPKVTLSQDLLSFEPFAIQRYRFSLRSLRLLILRYVQRCGLRTSKGAIFLTSYARAIIESSIGQLTCATIIPHGVDPCFQQARPLELSSRNELNLLYVSNYAPYKHHNEVLDAVYYLRQSGYKVTISLIGGGSGVAYDDFCRHIRLLDPNSEYIHNIGFVANEELPFYFSRCNAYLFASSCESFPVTLLEGMSYGLPILCSDRGPMPEILQNHALYFNPESCESIVKQILAIYNDIDLSNRLSSGSHSLSKRFSWGLTSRATFDYLSRFI